MNNYLIRLYHLIKDNLTMIALVPTLFGGIWQIIKLGTLSSNLIRFFSISQLLSDGILFLLIVLVPLVFIFPMLIAEDEVLAQSDNEVLNYDLDKGFLQIIINISLLIFIIFESFQISKFITIDNIASLIECIIYMYMVMFSLFFIIYKFITRDVFLHKLFFSTCSILICFVTLVSYNNISKNFHDISNFDKIITNLEKIECYTKKPEILYFNDKYIFIELEQKSKKSILIKKLDDLFEE